MIIQVTVVLNGTGISTCAVVIVRVKNHSSGKTFKSYNFILSYSLFLICT